MEDINQVRVNKRIDRPEYEIIDWVNQILKHSWNIQQEFRSITYLSDIIEKQENEPIMRLDLDAHVVDFIDEIEKLREQFIESITKRYGWDEFV